MLWRRYPSMPWNLVKLKRRYRPAARRKRKRLVGGNPCIRIEKNLETPLRNLFLFLSFSSFLTFFLFLARFYSDFLSFPLSFPALVSTNSFVVFVVRPEQKFIDSSEILRKFEDFRRYFRISIIFRWIWEAASIYYGRSFLYSIFYFGWGFTNLKLERRKFLFFIVI